jgi:4-hydroxy-4-methyl-2-oxoglutarate aldolase
LHDDARWPGRVAGGPAVIEEPPLLTVRRRFERPDAAQVAAFAGAQTGHVVDALGGRAALDWRIKPLDPTNARFCGVAVPCMAGPADILAVCAAIDLTQSGDVLVIATEAFRGTAVIGDIIAGVVRNRGLAAVVTDGCVRDAAGIRATGLPCFAAGVTPDSPNGSGPGTAGLPVALGGRSVAAGDIVLGDADGVVVVPFARIDAALAALAKVRADEAAFDARVRDGLTRVDILDGLMHGARVLEVE